MTDPDREYTAPVPVRFTRDLKRRVEAWRRSRLEGELLTMSQTVRALLLRGLKCEEKRKRRKLKK